MGAHDRRHAGASTVEVVVPVAQDVGVAVSGSEPCSAGTASGCDSVAGGVNPEGESSRSSPNARGTKARGSKTTPRYATISPADLTSRPPNYLYIREKRFFCV